MSEAPKFGVTVEAHVKQLLTEMTIAVALVDERVRNGGRLLKAERDALSRKMSGVQADAESVRLWLVKGAPRE